MLENEDYKNIIILLLCESSCRYAFEAKPNSHKTECELGFPAKRKPELNKNLYEYMVKLLFLYIYILKFQIKDGTLLLREAK